MTEMVKQALFHVIGDCDSLRVLDLFAGSGQLGIETLSRGAAFSAFVERNPANADHLKRTLKTLGVSAERARVLAADAVRYPASTRSFYDLVFMDPPYEKNFAVPALQAVVDNPSILAPAGRLVLRHTKHEPIDAVLTPSLERLFHRCYGDDVLNIWQKVSD